MAGVKGRSGTNPNRDKPFVNALRLEITEANGDLKRLRKIARAALDKAESGDMQAISFIADRLDGKPAQETNLNVSDKREASDWSRAELLALIHDNAISGGDGDSEGRRDKKPN